MDYIISYLTRRPVISSFNLTDEEVLNEILKSNENFLRERFTQEGLQHFVRYLKKMLFIQDRKRRKSCGRSFRVRSKKWWLLSYIQ